MTPGDDIEAVGGEVPARRPRSDATSRERLHRPEVTQDVMTLDMQDDNPGQASSWLPLPG